MKISKILMAGVASLVLAGAAQSATICGDYTFDASEQFSLGNFFVSVELTGDLDFVVEKSDTGDFLSGSYTLSNIVGSYTTNVPFVPTPGSISIPGFTESIDDAEFDPFWNVTSFDGNPLGAVDFDFVAGTGGVGFDLPIIGNVQLNLVGVSGSQEIKGGGHNVPDSGSTVTLLGVALLGFAGVQKRFRKAA